MGLVDPESHRAADSAPKRREDAIEALAARMRRSRAKGTTLDYDDAPDLAHEPQATQVRPFWTGAAQFVARLRERHRGLDFGKPR